MFLDKLKRAGEEGILLLVKYGLIIAFIIFAFKYFLTIQQMAINGQQAAIYLMELQKKGWLPQIINGQVSEKVIEKSSGEKKEEKK
jgi:hypothetical protein